MKKRAWKTRIKKACKDAGTYKPYFDYIIDTLSGILARRDEAAEILEAEDEPLIVEQTNKAGFTNQVKNPAYSVWDEMNKTALSYWRDLGLTPAGLKKINEECFGKPKEAAAGNSLIALLKEKREKEG